MRLRSRLDARQQRGVKLLGWASLVSLGGVTITGLWQFFAHSSDDSWFSFVPGKSTRPQPQPSQGVAELHSIFGAASAVVALVGGAWFAYKVLFDVPRFAVVSLTVCVFGLISGSVIRFNAVKLQGRPYEDAGRGYGQLFFNDVEFVVTDRFDLGPLAIGLWTMSHVLTVPVLLTAAWLGIARSDSDET